MSRVRSHRLTCPECGAILDATSEQPSDEPPACRILIVCRPAGWEPKSEFDVPAEHHMVDAVEDSVGDALTFIRQYNAASLQAGGVTWAVLSDVVATHRRNRVAKNFS